MIRKHFLTLLAIISIALASCANSLSDGKIEIQVIGTTDLHAHLFEHDFFTDNEKGSSLGLSGVASILEKYRAENKNIILVDNGDFLQGTPLADYYGNAGKPSPMISAFEELGFDVLNIGNHEFDYGLDYLEEIIKTSKVPIISSNIFYTDGKPLAKTYLIKNMQFTNSEGKEVSLRVGFVAAAPPKILEWSSRYVKDKLMIMKPEEGIQKAMDEIKGKVDLVIALSHGGLNEDSEENRALAIAQVPGITALIAGHSHNEFPNAEKPGYKDSNLINNELGQVNGIGTAQGKPFGVTNGQVTLNYTVSDGKLHLDSSKGSQLNPRDFGGANAAFEEKFSSVKQEVLNYIRKPLGTTNGPLTSYFALIQDDPSVELVSKAQIWYAQQKLDSFSPEDQKLPILSAAAPFKYGGRNGADYFTDIPAGPLAVKDTANLYIYPNTVYVLKINGATLRNWIDFSAGMFEQIRPNGPEQQLFNPEFRSYNFDVIEGVEYQIDVTKPARYDFMTQVSDSSRVVNLSYQGQPVSDDMQFLVVTNNYRASTNTIINPKGQNTIKAFPDETRNVILQYIEDQKEVNTIVDNNWSLAKTTGSTPLIVMTGRNAVEYAKSNENLVFKNFDSDGFALFDLYLK